MQLWQTVTPVTISDSAQHLTYCWRYLLDRHKIEEITELSLHMATREAYEAILLNQ